MRSPHWPHWHRVPGTDQVVCCHCGPNGRHHRPHVPPAGTDVLGTVSEHCGPWVPTPSPVPAELHDADDIPWEQRPNPRLLSNRMQAEFEAHRRWADSRPYDDVQYEVSL